MDVSNNFGLNDTHMVKAGVYTDNLQRPQLALAGMPNIDCLRMGAKINRAKLAALLLLIAGPQVLMWASQLALLQE